MEVPQATRIWGSSNGRSESRSYPQHLRWKDLSICRTEVQEEWYLHYYQCQVGPPSYHAPSFLSDLAKYVLMDRVAEVSEDTVKITIKNPKDKGAEPHAIEIPAGFVLWSTGIGKLHISLERYKLINSNATSHQTSRWTPTEPVPFQSSRGGSIPPS